MLKSAMINILVKGSIAITGAGADAASKQGDKNNKHIIFKILCHLPILYVK